jgi:hypothetical protein
MKPAPPYNTVSHRIAILPILSHTISQHKLATVPKKYWFYQHTSHGQTPTEWSKMTVTHYTGASNNRNSSIRVCHHDTNSILFPLYILYYLFVDNKKVYKQTLKFWGSHCDKDVKIGFWDVTLHRLEGRYPHFKGTLVSDYKSTQHYNPEHQYQQTARKLLCEYV